MKYPDLNSSYSKYLIYEKAISKGDTFKAKLEIASLLYDDESIELDKSFRVKEILDEKFKDFSLRNSAYLTSKNEFKDNFLLKDSAAVHATLKEMIAENELQMRQYINAIEAAEQERKQKLLAEEAKREQERQARIEERERKAAAAKEQKRKRKRATRKRISTCPPGKIRLLSFKNSSRNKVLWILL